VQDNLKAAAVTKTSSTCPAVSTEHQLVTGIFVQRLVTDRQTDERALELPFLYANFDGGAH